MLHPAEFHFLEIPASPAAEAAVRRRLRTLEAAYPAVLAWQVRVTGPARRMVEAIDYSAEVTASLAGGSFARAAARGADVLAALRLAFSALEQELDEDRERARARAAKWLSAVRSRIGQRQETM